MELRLSRIVSDLERRTHKNIDEWSPHQLKTFHSRYEDYIGKGKGSGRSLKDSLSMAKQVGYDYDQPIIKLSYGRHATPETITKKYSLYLFTKLAANGANEADIKYLLGCDSKGLDRYMKFYARTEYMYDTAEGKHIEGTSLRVLVDKVKKAGLHMASADSMRLNLINLGGVYKYRGKLLGNLSSRALIRRVVLYDSEGRALTDTKDIVKG